MLDHLKKAEQKAEELFHEIKTRGIILPNKFESQVNEEIYCLAKEIFGIDKYWHKRIVRAGLNTLAPYKENPEDIIIKEDDMVFLDFGPLIDDFEADFGRSYVIGGDPEKITLCLNIENAWYDIQRWVKVQKELGNCLKSNSLFEHCIKVANSYGYSFGGGIAGHLIGKYPHESLEPGDFGLYIHPANELNIFSLNEKMEKRHWILELHFVHSSKKFAAFFEQLLC